MDEKDMQALLRRLKSWFEGYAKSFSSDDLSFQENLELKAVHTRRVCEAVVDIGRSLDLASDDLCLAEISALLHDIGRFEQYLKYGTFSDSRSEDHALLGVKVIETMGILEAVEPDIAEIIISAVKYHNRATLPKGENERCIFFLKLLRDADKIDIWRVVTEYYKNSGNRRNRAIELDLSNNQEFSEPVCNALMNRKVVHMSELKTLNDFKLLQIGWVYDLSFPRTFQIVREKRYLEKIMASIPCKSARIDEIYKQAFTYLDNNCLRSKHRLNY